MNLRAAGAVWLPAELRCYPSVVSSPLCCFEGRTRTPPSKPWLTLPGWEEREWFYRTSQGDGPRAEAEEGELTLHVHVGCLVHEVHEELGGVDEDLVSAVADGAVPPGALWQMGRGKKKESGEQSKQEVCGTAGTIRKTYNNHREDDHEG